MVLKTPMQVVQIWDVQNLSQAICLNKNSIQHLGYLYIRSGQPIYYHGLHELCIIAGRAQNSLTV